MVKSIANKKSFLELLNNIRTDTNNKASVSDGKLKNDFGNIFYFVNNKTRANQLNNILIDELYQSELKTIIPPTILPYNIGFTLLASLAKFGNIDTLGVCKYSDEWLNMFLYSLTAKTVPPTENTDNENNNENKDKLDKTNTLIIGPTGTGKTFICNTLSKILNIPIFIADAGQFTESGYVGLSPNSVLAGLAKKCKLRCNKFPISIIYIDEIDKIAMREKHGEQSVGTSPVQEELLKIIESFNYISDGGKFAPSMEYDLSNVMFILGGAFSGLEEIIRNRINKDTEIKIGFNAKEKIQSNNSNILRQATSEDLIEYGFIPEFVGRLQNKIILNSLTKENLINILSTSQNNVISQYKQIFSEAGVKLNILDETIEYIAGEAIKNNTGARGLKSTISNILNKILFEAVSNEEKNFILTPEIIRQF